MLSEVTLILTLRTSLNVIRGDLILTLRTSLNVRGDNPYLKNHTKYLNPPLPRIKKLAAAHRVKLGDSLALHQFYRDLDSEEAWIR